MPSKDGKQQKPLPKDSKALPKEDVYHLNGVIIYGDGNLMHHPV